MTFLYLLITISSLSFLFYGISYFTTTKMKIEFKRFGLEKFGSITAILEILGALGLPIGIRLNPILMISSGGLTILMLLGVLVRIKMKDSLLVSMPAIIFMLLNACIFYISF